MMVFRLCSNTPDNRRVGCRPFLLAVLWALLLSFAYGQDAESAVVLESNEGDVVLEANESFEVQPQIPAASSQQVRIGARILEWTHGATTDYGFAVRLQADVNSDQLLRNAQILLPSSEIQRVGQGLTGLFSSENAIGDMDFDAIIQLLEQEGTVKVRSEPNIVVHFPAESMARVSTTSRVPYEAVQAAGSTLVQVTRFKDTSIMLEVQVEDIVDSEYVKIRMRTAVTDLSGSVKVGKNAEGEALAVPQTDQRTIENTILAKDGKAFITGVLKTTADYETSQGVPWLSKLPIIGALFRNKQTQRRDSELLFIVRPEILKN